MNRGWERDFFPMNVSEEEYRMAAKTPDTTRAPRLRKPIPRPESRRGRPVRDPGLTAVLTRVLDHHIFQNLLYGLSHGCDLPAFPPGRLAQHVLDAIGGPTETGWERLEQLPADVATFLVRYVLPLEAMRRDLAPHIFQPFCARAYLRCVALMRKYGVY